MKLLKTITECKGMAIISGYDNDLYNDYLKGWVVDKKAVKKSSCGVTRKNEITERPSAEEVLWIKPNCINSLPQQSLF